MAATPEDVLTLDLTQFDMREMSPEDLPEIGSLTPNMRSSLVTMASTFAYVSVAQAIQKADELVPYPVNTVEQAFQILIRERDRRRNESFAEKVASNKELPPTRQEIDDFNALVAWAKDSGNPHLANIANSRFTKAYEDENFNKSYFLGSMSAIRGLARGYGLDVVTNADDTVGTIATDTGDEEPF